MLKGRGTVKNMPAETLKFVDDDGDEEDVVTQVSIAMPSEAKRVSEERLSIAKPPPHVLLQGEGTVKYKDSPIMEVKPPAAVSVVEVKPPAAPPPEKSSPKKPFSKSKTLGAKTLGVAGPSPLLHA